MARGFQEMDACYTLRIEDMIKYTENYASIKNIILHVLKKIGNCDVVILLETVTRKEAIVASKTLYNFWMQFEKTTSEILDVIRKIRDEL
ncbi:hypothetical protein BRARA_D01128 [Brassica rapa]|uniref:Uncharacterized protein n=1 Tax=Brassica campestris TaxID=3711 RepID=A0A397ZLS2_BRACM|nr:hypothetical protein BRARA_D01128 [Brassica rapa]